jgi:hypothetical protein
MFFTIATAGFGVILLVGMLICLDLGGRIGRRQAQADPEGARVGISAIEAAIFGLLGLIVAFTFSGAASRFDARRHLIVEEANAIGTAYLRLDLLPAEAQPGMREKFRRYLDARLDIYRKMPKFQEVQKELDQAARLQREIWSAAQASCRSGNWQPASMLLLPAVNQMIDITSVRTMATQIHPPWVIYVLLFSLAISCSLLAGYSLSGSKSHKWLHQVVFALAIAITCYVIIDLEYPRLGLIRVDAADQVLVEVRKSMDDHK